MKTAQIHISQKAATAYREFATFHGLDFDWLIASRLLAQFSTLSDSILQPLAEWRLRTKDSETVTVNISLNQVTADAIVCVAKLVNLPTKELMAHLVEDDLEVYSCYLNDWRENKDSNSKEYLDEVVTDTIKFQEEMKRGKTPFTMRGLSIWDMFNLERVKDHYKGAHEEVFS